MKLARPVNVALVGPLPPPSGGMANQTRQLSELLIQEGATVPVVRVNAPYRPEWIGSVRGVRALSRLFFYAGSLWRAVREAELVHVMANSGWSWHLFAAPAVWISKLRGKPVVVNYRGGEADKFFQRSFRWVRFTLARADAIVVPSAYLQQVFDKWGFSTTIVPNIIDLDRFDRKPPLRTAPRHGAAFPHVIVTRNLEPIYDNASALRAFAIIKSRFSRARMTIAGSGPECGALKRLAEELGVAGSAEFLGNIDNRELPELYSSADVFLNPSLADNMPISVLEALASNVPIVSTNVGGIPFLLRDGETALLVPPQDHQAMADAIFRLLTDRDLATKITSAGARLSRQFTWPFVRQELLSVYEQVAAAEPRGAVSHE